MTNNTTRDSIAAFIHQEFGLTKIDCNHFVSDLIEEIISGLVSNQLVKIHNFGTFKIKNKKERIGRNPKTKEDVMISSRNVISFTISKNSLKIINKDLNE